MAGIAPRLGVLIVVALAAFYIVVCACSVQIITCLNAVSDKLAALRDTINLMNTRFSYMENHPADFSHVYLIIDELADLMTTRKRQAAPLLQELGQLARESKIHIIAATQCPLRKSSPPRSKSTFLQE